MPVQPFENQQEIARCLFRESNDALFLFDPRDHRVIDVNPVALRLTGHTYESAGLLRIWQLFRGPQPRGLAALIEAYQKTGFFHSREGYWLHRQVGDDLPVNLSVSRIHTRPDPIGVVTARDISERIRAQEALAESEKRLRSVVESARVLIWTLSAAGHITSVNPEFEFLTGWSRDQWLGRLFLDLHHPDDQPALREQFERALESGVVPFLIARIETRFEGYKRLELLSVSRVSQGRTVGVCVIARDLDALAELVPPARRGSMSTSQLPNGGDLTSHPGG
jgi:PAS domain S-box-containing protein